MNKESRSLVIIVLCWKREEKKRKSLMGEERRYIVGNIGRADI